MVSYSALRPDPMKSRASEIVSRGLHIPLVSFRGAQTVPATLTTSHIAETAPRRNLGKNGNYIAVIHQYTHLSNSNINYYHRDFKVSPTNCHI